MFPIVPLSVSVLQLMSPLNQEQAASARDALSKAIYGRTFSWLVNKINDSLAFKVQYGLFLSLHTQSAL